MYNVNVVKRMDLSFEDAGGLVAQVLMVDFEFISKEIQELMARRGTLKRHETEDLANNIEMRDAMKSLLRYYLTHDNYTQFIELQRVYGNVE